MRTIAITDIEGIRIGQVEDTEAATGVTVVIAPQGMAAGIDVRGGGPASRDTRTLDPLAAAERIHAVLLGGGSAFGLDAAGGVMRYLEERGIGLPVGDTVVPLVCQSDIFDLMVGKGDVRPDAAMGYAACVAAEEGNYRDGNFGAGCGATVGKAMGPEFCMKTGIGSFALQLGELKVGALVVLNAIGDVFDPNTGRKVAGLLGTDRKSFRSTENYMMSVYEAQSLASDDSWFEDGAGFSASEIGENFAIDDLFGAVAADFGLPPMPTNTTIGAIVTNAKLSKAQLCKVAGMAHDGYARAIRPVHTSMDGDSIYALSVGDVAADLDLVGTVAAQVMAEAILVAARSADPAYGLPSVKSL